MQIYAESLEVSLKESSNLAHISNGDSFLEDFPLKTLMDADDVNDVILFLISVVIFWFPLTSSTKVRGRCRIKNCALGTARKEDSSCQFEDFEIIRLFTKQEA